ncbi:carbohydrate-binding domain-containing protein [Luteolibacter arcticus]|uniref:Carbohydrate-binding domain-containing protein n=1 Tax=Luteolibacter arcticus TaxID=1581411 RepID=A0ABT3GJK4_9BACT|nr:carbohydrate-binding domain-containing protein [Luteolibacter arcticus]MCW1923679.1 carbohydrate-binding domain-containing protein [Luteolibacter arcticus]
MKSPCLSSVRFALLLSFLAPASLQAATVVWGGSTGDYVTPGNWVDGAVPDTANGDTAVINSGNATYSPGSDLAIHNGGALVINGGSWSQAGGDAWIQLSGGALTVAGGTFNHGSSSNIVRNASSSITVSAGVANFNGDFRNEAALGTFAITGGTVNIAYEFKPITSFTMSAGTLTASVISFADGPGSIDFTGGTISVEGASFYNGFYGGGTQSLNFSTGSTGSLFFRNYSLGELTTDEFLINGTIRWNGTIAPSSFSAVESDGGVLVTIVPEASTTLTWLAGMGALLMRRRRRAH